MALVTLSGAEKTAIAEHVYHSAIRSLHEEGRALYFNANKPELIQMVEEVLDALYETDVRAYITNPTIEASISDTDLLRVITGILKAFTKKAMEVA